jgi:hypothetical protein
MHYDRQNVTCKIKRCFKTTSQQNNYVEFKKNPVFQYKKEKNGIPKERPQHVKIYYFFIIAL